MVARYWCTKDGGQLPDAPGDGPVVGVDVGIKVLAFTSDGEEYDNPRWFRRGERKPRRINKAIARSIKTEPQQLPQSTWAALRATGTVAIPTGESTADAPPADCIRDSEARRYGGTGTVVVETLNVAGMVRNYRLAKALSDAAVGGFLRELEWQCVKRGVRLLKAGRSPAHRFAPGVVGVPTHALTCGCGCIAATYAAGSVTGTGERGPEPETGRPCFMGDDKRRWRRCESGPRAGDCQRSVYWTRQSLATALLPG